MAHDVFISHSTKDKAVSDAACALLERRGLRCWVAPRDILPGQEWGEAIIDGIRGARIFVLIFSGNANSSQQVRREVERAVGHNLPIIPFRIEEVKPVKSLEYFISNQHWLDALSPPMERHLERLADTILRLLAPPGEAPPPSRAPPSAAVSTLAPRRAGSNWPGFLIALVITIALAAAGAWWRRGAPVQEDSVNFAADNRLVDSNLLNDIAPVPMPPPPDLPPVPLLDFASVEVPASGSDSVDAAASLRTAVVPAEIRRLFPVDGRLVFLAGAERYGPLLDSRGGTTLLALLVGRRGPSAFTLRFDRPLAELRFTVPGFSSRNAIGHVAFPGFTATALDQYDRPLGRVDRAAVSFEVPAGEFTLLARERAIRAVRFEMDDAVTYVGGAAMEAGPPPPPPSEYVAMLISGIAIKGAADGAQ